ncbi:hypothetical protein [Amycolatopsis arida]|uniref:hypothetical protein n=1 Tax=Amycolatopsis arida TaxID=587909 RepID=UPI000B870FAB|nr:hypothetical protein [Amycolatopsis arida]
MEHEAFHLVAAGVCRYLDELAARANGERGPLAPEVVRLVAAWRALLRRHARGADGRCAGCGHRRWWLPPAHRNGELCTVWQVAVGYFLRRVPRR